MSECRLKIILDLADGSDVGSSEGSLIPVLMVLDQEENSTIQFKFFLEVPVCSLVYNLVIPRLKTRGNKCYYFTFTITVLLLE